MDSFDLQRVSAIGLAAFTIMGLAACGGGSSGTGGAAPTTTSSTTITGTGGETSTGGTGGTGTMRPPAGEDLTRDIVATDLSLDLGALTGTAVITLAASPSPAASFEIGDLEIVSVEDDIGPLNHASTKPAQLDVGVPGGTTPVKLTVKYKFKPHTQFDGWMPEKGVSFIWPRYCGNLFPCKSTPADGVRFTLAVTGVPSGQTAVYPASLPADAPSYVPAVAVGAYTVMDLGKTESGTQVNVWTLPGTETDVATGAKHLRGAFEFFEKTYGPYTFGSTVGSVMANWGPGSFGGMEHHPYWHVGKDFADSESTHVHEAAHGWYGDGVRIACWEDLILSEGTATYLAARALETFSVDAFVEYECQLKALCDPINGINTIALPDTCNMIDPATDPLISIVPYMKGAYWFREVAKVIGADVLDQALAAFYQANVGKAARMTDLIDAIKAKAGANAAQVDKLTVDWLKTEKCPVKTSQLCP